MDEQLTKGPASLIFFPRFKPCVKPVDIQEGSFDFFILAKMVKVATFFAMTLGAFVFWQAMDKVHVWIALHQDEKQERMKKEAEIRRMREELLRQNKERDSLL